MEQRYYYIYIITCTINQKSYVGSRFYDFVEPYFGSSDDLDIDISTYGLWNFSKEIIGIYPFIDRYERDQREGDNMELFDTFYPIGYNRYDPRKRKGFNMSGKTNKHTADHCRKIGESNKGKRKGKKHTPEQCRKISESQIGRVQSEETKKRIGNSIKGKKRPDLSERNRLPKLLYKCKYCGLAYSKNLINRWHNENCKHKPKN